MLTKLISRLFFAPKPIVLLCGAVVLVGLGAGAVTIARYVNRTPIPVDKSQTEGGVDTTLRDESTKAANGSTDAAKTNKKKTETKQPTKTETKQTAQKPKKTTNGGARSPTPAPTSPAPAGCPNGIHTPGGSDSKGGCWPYAGNTGVPAGTALSNYTGPCSIQSNTVIQDKTVNCALQIYNDASLTIRRSVVNGFIENTYTSGVGKLIVEDSEIHAGAWSGGSIWGSSMNVARTEVTGGQHSVHCENNCTVTDSWLHNQYNPNGGSYHNNAFISNGGTNMTIKHNTLHCTAILNATDGGCTGNLTLIGDFGTISYVNAESNLFMANNSSISFCTHAGWNPGKPYPNGHHITYRSNVFQRGVNKKCGVYGAVTSFDPSANGNVWTGNIWSDGVVLNP